MCQDRKRKWHLEQQGMVTKNIENDGDDRGERKNMNGKQHFQ